MAPMTARGQRSQGVIKARGLLPQPLDLHFQVIVSKMKNTGHLCPAPSPESETAQLPPKLQAQRPVTAAERTQPPTWPFGRGPAALEMRSRCLLIPGSPAAFLKGAPWAHHVVIPPGVGQRRPSLSWCYQRPVWPYRSTFPTSLDSASAMKTVGYLSLLIPHKSCPNGVVCLPYSFPVPEIVGLSLWGPILTCLLLIPHRSYSQPVSLPRVF